VSAVRLPPAITGEIDKWATDHVVSRSEAIRQLVEAGLKVHASKRPPNEKSAAKAKQMAGETLDKLADQSASEDERVTRKARLLKGPKEFRK
jgi:metal-responsive CopG/Arc/MetJ family transcriptional regulator